MNFAEIAAKVYNKPFLGFLSKLRKKANRTPMFTRKKKIMVMITWLLSRRGTSRGMMKYPIARKKRNIAVRDADSTISLLPCLIIS